MVSCRKWQYSTTREAIDDNRNNSSVLLRGKHVDALSITSAVLDVSVVLFCSLRVFYGFGADDYDHFKEFSVTNSLLLEVDPLLLSGMDSVDVHRACSRG